MLPAMPRGCATSFRAYAPMPLSLCPSLAGLRVAGRNRLPHSGHAATWEGLPCRDLSGTNLMALAYAPPATVPGDAIIVRAVRRRSGSHLMRGAGTSADDRHHRMSAMPSCWRLGREPSAAREP